MGGEVDAVREVLERHAPLLYTILTTVGALGTGDVTSIQLNEWTEFLNRYRGFCISMVGGE
jgi:hypothetical protein